MGGRTSKEDSDSGDSKVGLFRSFYNKGNGCFVLQTDISASFIKLMEELSEFKDVCLKFCDGREIKAHKLILLMISEYFQGKFRFSNDSSEHTIHFGEEVPYEAWEHILKLVYELELVLSYDVAKAVLKSAHYLLMKNLVDIIKEALKDNLSDPIKAIDILKLGLSIGSDDLAEEARLHLYGHLLDGAVYKSLKEQNLLELVITDPSTEMYSLLNMSEGLENHELWDSILSKKIIYKDPLTLSKLNQFETSFEKVKYINQYENRYSTIMNCDWKSLSEHVIENRSMKFQGFKAHPDEDAFCIWRMPNLRTPFNNSTVIEIYCLNESGTEWKLKHTARCPRRILGVEFCDKNLLILSGSHFRHPDISRESNVQCFQDITIVNILWKDLNIEPIEVCTLRPNTYWENMTFDFRDNKGVRRDFPLEIPFAVNYGYFDQDEGNDFSRKMLDTVMRVYDRFFVLHCCNALGGPDRMSPDLLAYFIHIFTWKGNGELKFVFHQPTETILNNYKNEGKFPYLLDCYEGKIVTKDFLFIVGEDYVERHKLPQSGEDRQLCVVLRKERVTRLVRKKSGLMVQVIDIGAGKPQIISQPVIPLSAWGIELPHISLSHDSTILVSFLADKQEFDYEGSAVNRVYDFCFISISRLLGYVDGDDLQAKWHWETWSRRPYHLLEDVQITALGIWSRGYTDYDDKEKYKENSLKFVEFLSFLQ